MSTRKEIARYAAGAGMRYASRAGGYLREGVGGVNIERVLTLLALAGGLYVGWKVLMGIRAVGNFASDAGTAAKAVTDAIGGAIGRGLYTLFHPNDPEYSGVSGYIVYFPDEKVFKYIGKEVVDKQGGFQIGGKFYDMVKLKPEARYQIPHPVTKKPWTVALVAKRVYG